MAYIIVSTTFDKKKDAENAAKKIIKMKLGACVQLTEAESFYRWNDKTQKAHEYRVSIKTLAKNYKKIENLLNINHPYSLPEIIATKIKKGSRKYLNWVKENC